ncbi:MAG: carboxymuconolactone decarboxylase family protein [Chthoniobacterales bacterium]
MNRIHQPDPTQATGKTKQLFGAVESKLGFVPNLMRVLGNSPAALEGYLGLNSTLAGGVLPAKLREQIALAVAEINGCGYCLSAHTVLGGLAGLTPDDILAARSASAANAKSDAALKLARAVTLQRGHIADSDLHAARSGGLGDAEIVEVVQHVALNILTNYTNNVARTVVDFPEVKPGEIPTALAAA